MLGGYFASGYEVNDLGQLVRGCGTLWEGDSETLYQASLLEARMRVPSWMSGTHSPQTHLSESKSCYISLAGLVYTMLTKLNSNLSTQKQSICFC